MLQTPTPTPTPTPTTEPPTDTPTDTPTESPTPTPEDGQPGFGIVVALLAMLGAALLAARRFE
jgi:PGF-CTERM protein